MDDAGGYKDYAFVAELYDDVIPYRYRPDVPFFVEEALKSGGPVLEIGCGTGRVLIPTARQGIEIVGLDLSPHMLAVCRDRLAREPDEVRGRVRLVEADMRDFDLGLSFRLVTTPFRPFQHLANVADQLSCLAAVRRHLEPGGRLILDIFNPSIPALAGEDVGQIIAEEPEFIKPDGRHVVRRHRIIARDHFNQTFQAELTYDVTHPDGRQESLVHAFVMRYLFRFEAEHLLARAGFQVEHLYAGYDRSPYGSTYPGELIFVARKAGG